MYMLKDFTQFFANFTPLYCSSAYIFIKEPVNKHSVFSRLSLGPATSENSEINLNNFFQ